MDRADAVEIAAAPAAAAAARRRWWESLRGSIPAKHEGERTKIGQRLSTDGEYRPPRGRNLRKNVNGYRGRSFKNPPRNPTPLPPARSAKGAVPGQHPRLLVLLPWHE
jgi:hypothetical protein